jgi:hypothetical protein
MHVPFHCLGVFIIIIIIIIIIFWGENLLAYADLQILFVLTLSDIKSKIRAVAMFVILMLS